MRYTEAVAAHGGQAPAARALGIPRSTLRSRLEAEAIQTRRSVPAGGLTFPSLPDRREPIDELLSRRAKHYNRLKTHQEAATWQRIEVNERKPIALCLVGDPHIDDDGCNWPALADDIALMRDTPGMYAVNIGDTTNNWVGRLARLFANQETSQDSARQLAEWFLLHAGIRWAAVLLGNHDQWNEGGEIIRRMCAAAPIEIPVHEWAAKIEFAFPNGATCRLNAAHDFKGRSIYSTTHGLLREAIWMQDGADILACGHIHFGGIQQVELPGGKNPWLVRVGSYKEHDHFALNNGFHQGNRFKSVVAIIDPDAPAEHRVSVFGSVAQGAAVLRAMRGDVVKCVPKKSTAKSRKAKPKRKAKRK